MSENIQFNFRDIEYISAIAKYQNLTLASQALFISQPSLSFFLKNIEHSLGIQLFKREAKKYILTEVGEHFVREGKKLLQIRSNLSHQLNEMASYKNLTLRLGMFQARAMYLLPVTLPIFKNIHPKVEISLIERNTRDLERLLMEDAIDIALINLPTQHDTFECHILCEDEAVLCINSEDCIHDLTVKKPEFRYSWIDLKTISNKNFIIAKNDPILISKFTTLLRENMVPEHNIIRVDHLLTAMHLTTKSIGLCFAFWDSMRFSTYGSILTPLSIGQVPIINHIGIAHAKGKLLPTYVHDFIQILRENYPHT